MTFKTLALSGLAALGLVALALPSAPVVLAHGDVSPQPVDRAGLPEVTGGWAFENPYRSAGPEVWERAVRIGASGYTQNCARCHGLEAISGGLAPDVRFLEATEHDDEWFLERMRHGMSQNGITRMPAFEGILSQEAMWAIRTYVESRPDDHAMESHTRRLREVRDGLRGKMEALETGAAKIDDYAEELAALHEELTGIAGQISTLSGAPVADSIARRAALILERGGDRSLREAAETLTVGLSAAQ